MANGLTLLLTPSFITLALHDSGGVAASAYDGTGNPIPIPNGTQVRVDDSSVVSAVLTGSLVTVTSLSVGTTSLRLTKGNASSNSTTVRVEDGQTPTDIVIAIPPLR